MASTDRRDGLIGNTGIKTPVKAASTANLTLNGEQTIDGVACVTGDRVLVKDQTNGVDNGIYTVDSGAWSRAKDCDGPYDLVTGTLVKVNGGTLSTGFWYVTTTGDITVGVTSIAFAQASTVLAIISAAMQAVVQAATLAEARTSLDVLSSTEISTRIQNQLDTAFTTGGTGTAFTLTPTPAITAYAAKQEWDVVFSAACGAAPTFQVSGLASPPNLVKQNADGTYSNLASGDFPSGWTSKVKMVSATQALVRALPTFTGHGQCRLVKSGANLVLNPQNGNKLIINGVSRAIPSAGVSLAPTGLTAGFYYIYAYMSGATMTLEASTTTHATDATTGVEIKSGDATRTLVGAAYSAAAAFTDQANSRSVISWFNRKSITGRAALTTARTTTSTSIAEINTEARVYFLTWADEAVYAGANGSASNSDAFQETWMAIGWDGVAVIGGVSRQANSIATSINSLSATSVAAAGQLTEAAIHYTVLGGAVSSGTGTFTGGADNGDRCESNILIRG